MSVPGGASGQAPLPRRERLLHDEQDPRRDAALAVALEQWQRMQAHKRRGPWVTLVLLALAIAVSWQVAQVDLGRLITGLPKIGKWLAQAWPPALEELPIFLLRMAETIAIAFLGTLAAVLAAVPVALLAARGTAPWPALRWPLRGLLNALRGVD